MKVLVFCGGRGTRAHPHTLELPKPLMDVGDAPILRHVMDIFARQGVEDFVLAAGFRADLIERFASTLPTRWRVRTIDTGEDTNKGDRMLACRDAVSDGTFFATYGDGLGNVDLGALRRFHENHAGLATVTTVPLPTQYGTIDFDRDGRVNRFIEKPSIEDHWINAGFFVFDPAVFNGWPGGDLEPGVLPALTERQALFAYRHKGFWRSMDTFKDSVDLTTIYASRGDRPPPWLT